jgi:hypothetical protein
MTWQDKLSLRSRAGNLVSLFDNAGISKVNYGILVHSILASIRKTDEVADAIEKIVYSGLIGSEERQALKSEISEVLAVPEIARFFGEKVYALTERELILPDGEVLRPDRIVIENNKASVVDFKTGKRMKKHEDQVGRYVNEIRKMDYDSVEGWLIYLNERVSVKVS